MHVKAVLDVDLVAVESTDQVTLLVDLTAPTNPGQVNRPGQAVQVVLDRSGSMAGAPLQAAKNSLLKLVDRLAPQDSFGLIAFDDSALVVVPMRTVTDHHLPTIKKAIKDLDTGGSTDLATGYLMGLRELNRVTTLTGGTLLLISDGQANSGETDPKFFSEIAQKATEALITSSSIGLGIDYDEKILEAVAQGGGGAHRFAATVDEAVGAIAAEVSKLLDKSAINAMLRLTPTGVMTQAPAIELLQRLPYWKDGETYVVQLGDLYSGENRRFVIDIPLPGLAALGLCKIADLTVEYLDLSAKHEVSVTMPVNVNVVPGDVAAGRIADSVVRAERLILQAQSVKSDAVADLQSGNRSDAATKLRSTAARLRSE
ncbi:MAG: VWA domain-containing protein, partial [Actinobacteria bacterium]|nr:VWA domain-containing protein [Actinomycetota bacterium]